MKYVWILGIVFLVGCSSKVVPKTQNPSFEIQKQDADKAWRELDKE